MRRPALSTPVFSHGFRQQAELAIRALQTHSSDTQYKKTSSAPECGSPDAIVFTCRRRGTKRKLLPRAFAAPWVGLSVGWAVAKRSLSVLRTRSYSGQEATPVRVKDTREAASMSK